MLGWELPKRKRDTASASRSGPAKVLADAVSRKLRPSQLVAKFRPRSFDLKRFRGYNFKTYLERVFRGRNLKFRGEGRIFAAETLTQKANVSYALWY